MVRIYDALTRQIQQQAQLWGMGTAARLAFAAVLLQYFWQSAMTKIENGFFGFLSIKAGAYSQIIPSVFEQAGYDIGQIAFIPYGLIVHLGTYSEFILPLLIVLGLCTRLAAVGMIGFILVQSIVDIFFHHVDVATIGAWFDRDPASTIADQRGLWVLLLFALVCFGAGRFSLDHLIVRWRQRA